MDKLNTFHVVLSVDRPVIPKINVDPKNDDEDSDADPPVNVALPLP